MFIANYDNYNADGVQTLPNEGGLDWDKAPWSSIVGFCVLTTIGSAILLAKVYSGIKKRRQRLSRQK